MTAVVQQMVNDNQLRRKINDWIVKNEKEVEQVAFVDKEKNEFMMAGRELSINGLRSGMYELANPKGNWQFRDVGLWRDFWGGAKNSKSWVELETEDELLDYRRVGEDFLVNLRGISYLVKESKMTFFKNKKTLCELTLDYLNKFDLMNKKAAGVVFYQNLGDRLEILPIVWIRDMRTVTVETACGSGSMAMGISKVIKERRDFGAKIWQPSGEYLKIKIAVDGKNLGKVRIGGMVKKIGEGEVEI